MNNSTQISPRDIPLRQITTVKDLLINKNAQSQLQNVAAKHMNPERMMRVLANACRTTPRLAECDPMSLLGALMNCASLGLEPNTPLGQAYLIPFKNNRKGITEVQLIIGYKGLADMARRTGQIKGMHSDVVYDDDELWSYEYGSDQHLRHKPGPRLGKPIAAYCHVKLNDGGEVFGVLPWPEIMRIRDNSQGWKTAKQFGKTASSPWSLHEDAMASKTALRALANRGMLPLSTEFIEAVEQDDKKPNFADFAMNPDDGLTIDAQVMTDDADFIDDNDVKPKAKEKSKAKEKPKTKPETKQKPEEGSKAEVKPKEKTGIERDFDTIVNDLTDSPDVESVLSFHADKIRDIRDLDAGLGARLDEEIEAARLAKE